MDNLSDNLCCFATAGTMGLACSTDVKLFELGVVAAVASGSSAEKQRKGGGGGAFFRLNFHSRLFLLAPNAALAVDRVVERWWRHSSFIHLCEASPLSPLEFSNAILTWRFIWGLFWVVVEICNSIWKQVEGKIVQCLHAIEFKVNCRNSPHYPN